MADKPYDPVMTGFYTGEGFDAYEGGTVGACPSKVFYISGFKVTKRKTSLKSSDEPTKSSSRSAECTVPKTSPMFEITFKTNSKCKDPFLVLENKKFIVPAPIENAANIAYDATSYYYNYKLLLPYAGHASYLDPGRRFLFSFSDINVEMPLKSKFFNFSSTAEYTAEKLAWENSHPNTEVFPYTYTPLITKRNSNNFIKTKNTPTFFRFESFHWNTDIKFIKNTRVIPYARVNQVDGWTTQPYAFADFSTSDFCYVCLQGLLYLKHITLIPKNPVISEVMGIESILIRRGNF